MTKNTSRLLRFLPLTVGVLYFTLWTIAEAGRLGATELDVILSLTPFVIFGSAIAISDRWPWAALVLIGAGVTLQFFVERTRFSETEWAAYVPLLYALANITAFARARVWRWIAMPMIALAVSVGTLIVLDYGARGRYDGVLGTDDDRVFALVLVVGVAVALGLGAWASGVAIRVARERSIADRERRRAEQDLHAAELELAALTERDRFAQDVHDVLAHSLAVVAAQAEGTRLATPDAAPAVGTALTAIADTAREGLVDLRRLLDEAPHVPSSDEAPRLVEVPALVERMRATGHDCELVVLGETAALTPLQETSAYRIVQESLTNALKHAGANSRSRVVMDWRGPGAAITISTSPVPNDAAHPPGRGTRGMEERARIAGGWLTAGPDDGAFLVSAFIPAAQPNQEQPDDGEHVAAASSEDGDQR